MSFRPQYASGSESAAGSESDAGSESASGSESDAGSSADELFSGAWVERFNRVANAAGKLEVQPTSSATSSFSMCQSIPDAPGGPMSTTLVVEDGKVRMEMGENAEAQVFVRIAWSDAKAMSLGTISPIDAIASGRIKVRGNLTVLVEAQKVLAGVHSAMTADGN